MPDMPGNIARPKFMRAVDAHLNDSVKARHDFAHDLLSGASLRQACENAAIGEQQDWQHLELEYYAEESPLAYWPTSQWPDIGNKQEVIRQGLLEAIRVAEGLEPDEVTPGQFDDQQGAGKPVKRNIEMWWCCAGHHFEVNVLDGANQVTMVILTPSMPTLPDDRKVKLEKDGFIWIVGHKDELQGYIDTYPAQDRLPELQPVYPIPGREAENEPLRRLNKFTEAD